MAQDPRQPEHTSHEKRRWVRLSRVCNNRCLFCLDAHIIGPGFRESGEILDEIREGAAEGCNRLILSGGEPTLHPDYLDMVAYGRQQGYGWIQTVTNGRMFAYAAFAERAASAGLNEVTFSMHAHTAGLHDELVGVTGAFEQSLQGMDRLVRHGVVVNVDVVINARNVRHLPGIIDFFLERGIREFDLLWMVPFGRAWDHRAELFCDPPASRTYLDAAIRRAADAGAVVWTNRLPAELLEGHERLIQDPQKLHDEIRGRRPEFAGWLGGESPMICREPERCQACFLEGFCEMLERAAARMRKGTVSALRLDLRSDRTELPPGVERVESLRVEAEDMGAAVALMREWKLPPPSSVVVELSSAGGEVPGWVSRLASTSPAVLDSLLHGYEGPIEVILNRETAGWIAERIELLREKAGRLVFSLQAFRSSDEVESQGTHPVRALAPVAGSGATLLNLPACFLPGARLLLSEEGIPARALPRGAATELSPLADHFIARGYRVYSFRCRECPDRAGCPGIPVDYVRVFGFGMAVSRGGSAP